MPSHGDGAVGALYDPPERRKRMAREVLFLLES